MITDLAFLLRQAPVCRNLEGRLTPEQFRDQLNHHIHGYGSLGYEEAEQMNLLVSSKYTTEEAQELFEQIKISRSAKEIDVKEIDDIPFGIAHSLAQSTGSGAGTIEKARNSSIKIGAIRGFELVGFLSGSPFNDSISIGGLYVIPLLRGKGLSNKMFLQMYMKAKSDCLKGFVMSNASWNGQDALGGFHRYLERNGIKSIYSSGSEDLSNWAELKFLY